MRSQPGIRSYRYQEERTGKERSTARVRLIINESRESPVMGLYNLLQHMVIKFDTALAAPRLPAPWLSQVKALANREPKFPVW